VINHGIEAVLVADIRHLVCPNGIHVSFEKCRRADLASGSAAALMIDIVF
jgi:hypothetical protein